MINSVTMVGRVTKDIELKHTQGGGVPFATFTVAVNRTFKNSSGEYEADFVNCIAWRKTAENIAKYVGKGSLVGVEGRIETSNFERDGERVFLTRVLVNNCQFLETKKEREQRNGNNYSNANNYSNGNGYSNNYSGNAQPNFGPSFDRPENPLPMDNDLPF